MIKMHTSVALLTSILLTGCVGGTGYNNNMAGNGYGVNPLDAIQNSIVNSATQSIANSILTGGIGSQLPSVDQSFRLQQLTGALQSGSINQSQQWVNPQTGSQIVVNPIGQASIQPQTQQQCQTLEEVVKLPNGQSLTENRVACLNPQTGKWTLQ